MKMKNAVATSLLSALVALSACATAPKGEAKRDELKTSATSALASMEADDASLHGFLKNSHAYVVFPHVGKGGAIVGGSYGRGIVYKNGNPIGYADITQATVGLQVGGQTFMELLAFESADDLNRFTSGKLAFAANVSAVVLKTGAAESAKYNEGAAVFVKPIGGAMVEASIGGQQFSFEPG